jgi:NAD-dependent dihydropyrimidine dehydrogenase PreA subunit
MAFEVIVDKEKCKGCEECLEVCTVKVFEMQESKPVPVNVKECLGCQSCTEVCKEKAITVKELEIEMSETTRLLLRDLPSD